MKYIILLFLLFLIFPVYADIAGDVSIGKDGETGKGCIRLAYDFEMKDLIILPFVEYTNYFYIEGLQGKPYEDIFGLGIKLEYRDIYLKLYHECLHPVAHKTNIYGDPILDSDTETSQSNWLVVGYRWGRKF